MKLIHINDNILQIDFNSQKELTQTFIRFQEFYESPKFKGTIFTLNEFRKWYTKEYGKWSYYTDWSGFNIPSNVLLPFISGEFNPLSKKEQTLLNILPKLNSPYYIIGTFLGGKQDVLNHEICHGLFYTNLKYREAICNLLATVNSRELRSFLMKKGYHHSVCTDEVHAYICCNEDYLKKQNIKYPKIGKKLRNIKNLYYKGTK